MPRCSLFTLLPSLVLLSCAGSPALSTGSATRIDHHPEQATIEDYILALPPFTMHEEPVEAFRKRVLSARSLPQNREPDRNRLFVGGDGTQGSTVYTLDPVRHALTMHTVEADGDPATTYTMTRVDGGWKRGSEVQWSGRIEDVR